MVDQGHDSRPTPTQSSFAGDPAQAWSLRRAVDALAHAARDAGRPSSLWLAGLLYPSIGLGLLAGLANLLVDGNAALGLVAAGDRESLFQTVGYTLGGAFGLVLMTPLLFFVFRLQAGLARIAPPAVWAEISRISGPPRLRHAWRAGRGLTAAAGGLNVLLIVTMGAVLALVCLPIVFLWEGLYNNIGKEFGAMIWLGVLLPGLAFLSIYAVLLSILQLLALQSLASNKRGVASALTHAWRLAKHDPWSTGRTVAVGLMLDLAISVLSVGLSLLGDILPVGETLVVGLATMALLGFAGVTRAGYWARAYQALGGWSTQACRPEIELVSPGGS